MVLMFLSKVVAKCFDKSEMHGPATNEIHSDDCRIKNTSFQGRELYKPRRICEKHSGLILYEQLASLGLRNRIGALYNGRTICANRSHFIPRYL